MSFLLGFGLLAGAVLVLGRVLVLVFKISLEIISLTMPARRGGLISRNRTTRKVLFFKLTTRWYWFLISLARYQVKLR